MMRGGTYLHVKGERLKQFLPPQMPYVNMQRGPRTRLATAGAIPWCRLLRFRVQVNGAGWKSVMICGRPCGWQFPRHHRAVRSYWNVVARVKEVVQDDANALKPNFRAQHCAIALGCATENEQQNAGCKWTNLRIACIINKIPMNLCLAFLSWFDVFRA